MMANARHAARRPAASMSCWARIIYYLGARCVGTGTGVVVARLRFRASKLYQWSPRSDKPNSKTDGSQN